MKKKDPYFQPIPQILEQMKVGGKLEFYERGEINDKDIIDSLKALQSYIPLESEVRRKRTTTWELIDEWFAYKVGSVYEELSSDIFKMETKVDIDLEKANIKTEKGYKPHKSVITECKVPVFLNAKLDSNTKWEKEYSYEDKYNKYTYAISSRMPQIPSSVRKDGAKALALAYSVYSEALETEVLGDIILQNPDYATHPARAEQLVLWKARPEDLQIEVKKEELDKDPVLILNWNRPYLVSTWIEPNEDPLLDLLPFFKKKPKPI
jgi:hypothetical protein